MTATGSSLRTLIFLMTCCFMLVACAAAPVQELSDARQALDAARAADSGIHAPAAFARAERLMTHASQQASAGDYDGARKTALSAKYYAVEAREAALEARAGD